MKTLLSWIVIVALFFTLTAFSKCGGPYPPPAKQPETIQPAPTPSPTLPTLIPPMVVKDKPIMYYNKGHIGYNKAAAKLLSKTHVIHVQHGRGYDIIDLRGGKLDLQFANWPASWSNGAFTIGIYNPSTGQYAVSARVK